MILDILNTFISNLETVKYHDDIHFKLYTLLSKLEMELFKYVTDSHLMYEFINSYYLQLHHIHEKVLEIVSELPTKNDSLKQFSKLKDIIHRLFDIQLKAFKNRKMRKKIIHIFRPFIRGITRFTSEVPTDVKYRYLERLIYDIIWSKVLRCSQDPSHIKWLNNVREEYKNTYPGSFIHVEILFAYNSIPITLRIIEDGSETIYEKYYNKNTNTYNEHIYSLKYDHDGRIYKQENTNEMQGEWQYFAMSYKHLLNI